MGKLRVGSCCQTRVWVVPGGPWWLLWVRGSGRQERQAWEWLADTSALLCLLYFLWVLSWFVSWTVCQDFKYVYFSWESVSQDFKCFIPRTTFCSIVCRHRLSLARCTLRHLGCPRSWPFPFPVVRHSFMSTKLYYTVARTYQSLFLVTFKEIVESSWAEGDIGLCFTFKMIS